MMSKLGRNKEYQGIVEYVSDVLNTSSLTCSGIYYNTGPQQHRILFMVQKQIVGDGDVTYTSVPQKIVNKNRSEFVYDAAHHEKRSSPCVRYLITGITPSARLVAWKRAKKWGPKR